MPAAISDNGLNLIDEKVSSEFLEKSAIVLPELSYKDFPQPDTEVLSGAHTVIYFNGTDYYLLDLGSSEWYLETFNNQICLRYTSNVQPRKYIFDKELKEWNQVSQGYTYRLFLGFTPNYLDYYILYSNYDIKDFNDKETVLFPQTVLQDDTSTEIGDTYNITVQLDEEPFLTKDFDKYTTTDGFLLIITVLLLFIFFRKIFNLDTFKGV